MAQTSIRILLLMGFTIPLLLISGCGDENYDAGIYWLNKKENPHQAVRYFQRSINENPKRWKSHKMAIECMALIEDPIALETQIKLTLQYWPDSSRSEAIYNPAVQFLGEKKYNLMSAPIAQRQLGNLLGEKGDRPEILSSMIMVSCRMNDTIAARDYFERLLNAVDGENPPDSVVQELGFLIGPAGVDWLKLEWQVTNHPEDIEARIAQLDAGLVVGDSTSTRKKLTELASQQPDAVNDISFAKRYSRLVGVDPFNSKKLVKGWDGSLSPNRKYITYIKDLGRSNDPDLYIYRATASGGQETPLMKGVQQYLPSLAWPKYSPDGKWIYFYGSDSYNWSPSHSSARFQLYRIRPQYGSKPRKLTDENLLPVVPHFSNDGSIYLVRRDVGSSRSSIEVIKLFPDKRKMEVVSRIGEPVGGATFTPKGDSLIFTTDRGIFRRSVNGGRITVDITWRGLHFPMISPDGKKLLVHNRVNHALLIDRTTKKLTFIGKTAMSLGSFSNDGKLLITQDIGGKHHIIRLDLERKMISSDKFLAAIKK
ncbi:MAG: hypothetical protein P9X24_08595 [Candidatus Hatepunaea meridiana]|nr:hypothetical protein [Candidatus Hatepunaea meridiana]